MPVRSWSGVFFLWQRVVRGRGVRQEREREGGREGEREGKESK